MRRWKQIRQTQAMGVVVLSIIAQGSCGPGAGRGFVGSALLALMGFIWAFLVYIIGTFFPSRRPKDERTTGFSASPGLLRVLGVIPGELSFLVRSGGAMIIAVRQALDYRGMEPSCGGLSDWMITLLLSGGRMAQRVRRAHCPHLGQGNFCERSVKPSTQIGPHEG